MLLLKSVTWLTFPSLYIYSVITIITRVAATVSAPLGQHIHSDLAMRGGLGGKGCVKLHSGGSPSVEIAFQTRGTGLCLRL